jgi:hypothetical protein
MMPRFKPMVTAWVRSFAPNLERKASLARFGYTNVSVHKADAKTFDYHKLGMIAFALVDLDLYNPVRVSLERIIPHMAPGGIVIVDDCDAMNDRWDGALHAYCEFCKNHKIKQEIACGSWESCEPHADPDPSN